jgi:magnesium chelatase subunit D
MPSVALKPQFPFAAVIGQDALKTALVLTAINPAIGGVLISGPRGSAKSTLARGLADLLPGGEHDFVTLPLGASEEMLTGTLDLQQVLAEQQVAFNPGLLARSHGGVLYVDEVNLLADPLVDLLLDVAASGINHVERDGISHQHAAEFLLVGTMNPDEGELRPQLQDRFGLAVHLKNQYSADERMAIVRQRVSFDSAPSAFCQRYADEQSELLAQIAAAKQHLAQVTLSDEMQRQIAQACLDANVDGLRADLSWHRAALAHAAWLGRHCVTQADVDAVAELVLSHRRQPHDETHHSPPPPPPPAYRRPPPPESSDSEGEGDWGAMVPQRQESAASRRPDWERASSAESMPKPAQMSAEKTSGQRHQNRARGRQRIIDGTTQKVNWFATLAAAENRGHWPPEQWRYQRQKGATSTLNLVLLDTSSSTLKGRLLAQAKGLILGVAEQAYLTRQQLAIYGFGNQRVDCLLKKGRAPKQLRGLLDQVKGGGGTPLRLALIKARQVLTGLQRCLPCPESITYIITDGRSSDYLADIELPGQLMWIDTEQSEVKRGRGRQLAQQLNARYLTLSG